MFGYALLLSCISLLKTLGTMPRSQWQTLAELDEILNKAARLTDKSYSIELPHDKGGNLSMNESIELFKKEIIKTINQIKTEESQ